MNIPLTKGFFLSLFVLVGSLLALHKKEFPIKEKYPHQSESKRLHAVKEYADLLLDHGRDTYRDQHNPLFVESALKTCPVSGVREPVRRKGLNWHYGMRVSATAAIPESCPANPIFH